MLHHLVINYYLFHFNRELGLNVGYCINNQISHITQPFPFLHLSNCTLPKLQRCCGQIAHELQHAHHLKFQLQLPLQVPLQHSLPVKCIPFANPHSSSQGPDCMVRFPTCLLYLT